MASFKDLDGKLGPKRLSESPSFLIEKSTNNAINVLGGLCGYRPPSIADGIISTFKSRLIASGDTVTDRELELIKTPLERLMRGNAYTSGKIRELWVPLGTSAVTGALVKLIADPTAGNSMTSINLVAGDYSANGGITGNATNKAVNTGFNPTAAGVTASSWGFGVYVKTTASGSKLVAGTLAGTSTYIAYAQNGDSKINNILMNGTLQYPRFLAVQADTSEVQFYQGAYKKSSAAYASPTLSNSPITLLQGGNSFWSDQTVNGYCAWSPALTSEEMLEVVNFFDSVAMALGREGFKPKYTAIGDSNARGYVPPGGTAIASTYSALVSARLGLTEHNRGVDDSTMSNSASGGATNWVAIQKNNATGATGSTFFTVALGTNDARYGVSIAEFLNDYENWLSDQFLNGFHPSQFILISPIAATDAATNQRLLSGYRSGIKEIAKKFGCGFYDAFNDTSITPGVFQSDNLHLNSAGHSLMASGILKEIAKSSSGGYLSHGPSYL